MVKATQYKPQLYILVVRYDAPSEAFLSSVFSINTTYRCTSNGNAQKKQKTEDGSPLGIIQTTRFSNCLPQTGIDFTPGIVPLPLTRTTDKLGTIRIRSYCQQDKGIFLT